MGAGEAKAQQEFWSGHKGVPDRFFSKSSDPLPKGNPDMTAVAIKRPNDPELDKFAKNNSKFKYVEEDARFLHEENLLKPADLITDSMGPFAYSDAPDLVLFNYLKLLRPGGEIYISPILHNLKSWLKNIKGITVTDNGRGVIITMQDPTSLKIPILELENAVASAPPSYTFKLEGSSMGLFD